MKHRSFAHRARAVALWAFSISAVFVCLAARAQAPNPDGTGFAGAYAPSKSWQPPRDPQALAKLRKFQDLKFGFFYCWGTQTQWGTVDQSWCLCPERYDWNIALVGHRSAPLAVTVGTDGLAVVELSAAARANPPCSEAWALRIQPPNGN
jgi:hypothetical protein